MNRWSRGLIDELIERHSDVRDCAPHDLLSMWTALAARIHRDGIVQLEGNLPANLAEQLVARWKQGEVTRGSNPGFDVVAANTRYQVKCLRRTDPGRNSVTTLPESLDFHQLVIVVFEYDLSLCAVVEISAVDLIEHGPQANDRRIEATDHVDPEVLLPLRGEVR